jgi:FkbM family methyltransferase
MTFSYSDAEIAELISEFSDPRVREAAELAALPGLLKDTSYFIDVGANVGQYTYHAATHLRNAKVVAIEANPFLIPALTRTVEKLRSHNSPDNQYEIHAAAVSDTPGALKFYVSRYPTLSSVFRQNNAEQVEVPALALDTLWRPSVRTVIKIDVEGVEYRVIRSGTKFLRSNQTSFFVELHSWGDRTIGKYPVHVCWLFLAHGYALRKIGTHYLFYRASWLRRSFSFMCEFPSLGLKYLVCCYAPGLQPLLNRWRRRMRHSLRFRVFP